MPSTFFGLDIGKTGLFSANVGLNTAGHNVSNENTKGYSRQVLSQQARSSLRVYTKYGMVGTGVEITSIDRVRDIYYDSKYRSNNAKLGEHTTKYTYGVQVEDYFNEMVISGFKSIYNDMFGALQDLNGTPESLTVRTEFLNFAQSLGEYMNDIQTRLYSLQSEVNMEVSNNVSKINLYAEQIASLTKQINNVELAGGVANDLRDRRDVMLDELSSIVPVSVTETKYSGGKSDYLVRVGDFTMVNNYSSHSLELITRKDKNNEYDIPGLYDIYYYYDHDEETGTRFDVQAMNLSGNLRGLLDVRDGNNKDMDSGKAVDYKGIPHYLNRVQEFKQAIADAFNNVHSNGINLNGDSTNGVPIFTISKAGELEVNKDLLKDPSLMGTTKNPIHDGISDASLVVDFLDLQDAKILYNASAGDYLETIVTEISVSTKKAQLFENNYDNIVKTVNLQRMSVSGVDGEEEAMNIEKYQEAYTLCARVITVMSECYSKLINETGI